LIPTGAITFIRFHRNLVSKLLWNLPLFRIARWYFFFFYYFLFQV